MRDCLGDMSHSRTVSDCAFFKKLDTFAPRVLTQAELDRYGETSSRKIVLMIGWFNMLSLFLNGCRVPLETTDKVGTRTSPLG